MDNAGRDNAISIVISRKQNEGIQGNGNAHITEYFYSDKALREAGGEAVAGIARSIKQALYSGEYKDTTGLAEVQEVNAETIREHRAYHGTGTDIKDGFDFSYMGAGTGFQFYGWGGYVTEVEGFGRTYAKLVSGRTVRYKGKTLKEWGYLEYLGEGTNHVALNILSDIRDGLTFKEAKAKYKKIYQDELKEWQRNAKEYFGKGYTAFYEDAVKKLEECEKRLSELNALRAGDFSVAKRHLYTVEIPDDTGSNYLDWNGGIESLIDRGVVTIEEAEAGDMASGRDVYEYLADKLGSRRAASEFLSSLGFTGIKTPAEYPTTGGYKDGAYDYVIFKESDMKITDHVRFFKTADGEAYGFTVGGKIYLDPRMAKADTPIHEYTHLWADALRQMNPKEWKNIVELMKGTPVWEEVKKSYPELKTDNEIADEVLATYSGQRGAERLREQQRKIAESGASVLEKAEAISVLERVKEALKKFWKNVADFLHIHFTTAEEVADRVLGDLLNGVNPLDYTRADSRLRMQEQAEEQAIIEQAKADGTYMKAPNGKPTNLTEKQWVQVRTKAFKKWFGDWGKAARIEKLRHSEPIEVEFNGQYELNRNSAKKWLKANIKGEYRNADTGEVIVVSNIGVDKVTSHGEREEAHLKSMVGIPAMIANSIFLTETSNEKGNGKYDSYRYYVCGVKIDGVDYTAKIVVGVKDGTRFYDNELTEIEKGALIDNLNGIAKPVAINQNSSSTSPSGLSSTGELGEAEQSRPAASRGETQSSPVSDIKDKRLLSILQTNSSKVVDENGEPMVVYRGADGNYTVFDKGKIREREDGIKGFYFAPPKRRGTLAGYYGDGKTASFFLNIRNPLVNYTDTKISVGDTRGHNGIISLAVGDAPEMKLYDYEKRAVVTEKLERGDIVEIVAFDPNQIKSATDNTGAFSAENDDIRYRQEAEKADAGQRDTDTMRKQVERTAEKLHLEGVEIVTDKSGLQGRKARAKGFYDPKTGKITIVLPNNADLADAVKTLLHEGVAHHGLRKLFGEHFDTFLDEVFNNASEDVRRQIVELAKRHGWNFRTATEEYLASLAEKTDFENIRPSWWKKIKELFLDMLRKAGIDLRTYNDNELRYILWRSYENLRGDTGVFAEAADIAKQYELKVGEYAERDTDNGGNRNAVPESIREANDRFNEELRHYQSGEMEQNEMFHLGQPENVMRKFLPKLPIVMRPRVMNKASNTKHNVEASSLKDLPQMISAPIFVFKRSDKAIGILTEIKDRNGLNVCVAIELDKKIQNGGEFLEVNDIRSVHGRNASNLILPIIHNDTLAYVDKEKGLAYLSSASYNYQQEIDKQDLDSAVKVIENFENPNIEEGNVGDEVLFRAGDPEIHERARARDRYERRMKSGLYQSQEALQDSMLSLKEAMTAILGKKTYIEEVEGFENAYLGENRLSSVNKAEADAFGRLLFKPMLDEAAKLAKTETKRGELTDYMMAKHGLERNRVMAERDAQEAFDKNSKAHPTSKKTLQEFIDEYRQKDYAGLTALTGMDSAADAEAEAQRMVDAYEAAHGTAALWNKVRAVNKAILQKSSECGMMNRETFDKVSSMYEYYIPLRGFDEKTSSEAYAYLTHKESAFNAPIKAAKGRKSKADDPFANMEAMAESAIMQGNRNVLVKQRFLNFVLNHPSDLVSVSDLWLQYDAVSDEWKPVFPEGIETTDTPEEVERKMQDFETRMEALAAAEPDMYKRGKDAANIPYRVVRSRDLHEHQVIVKRGGRDIVLTVNGNPRLAQALNGLTNPDNDIAGFVGPIFRLGEKINRELSAFYTTRNPDFVLSNFMRDMFYTNTMVWVKESPNYALRFHRHCLAEANPANMKILLAKYRKGTLDMSDKTEAMFYHFMMNGGETGYANIRDIEKHKNDIRRELKKANGRMPVNKALGLLGERFDEYNRAIENAARFAAFMTSREMGRSLDRAIYDAKEISVNFNKKGSGAIFLGKPGQKKIIGNVAAFVFGAGRAFYVFWNAAIQGTTNIGRQFKRHPAKAFTGMAAMYLLGALVASIGGDDDDDDKNAYYNLPEYVRRSNILFRAGDHWISIPLPVEYRAVYGLGELMASTLGGKEHLTDGELAEAIAAQVSQCLPIDFMEGGGGMNAFIPSSVKPWAEAHKIEKSWTGMPLYKGARNEDAWNKDMPEWTKAYSSTNKYLVGLAAALNEASGGDRYTKGAVDINPAKLEYMLNGYFGGVSGTIDKMTKMAETFAGKREFDPRNFLLLNRVLKAGDERTEYRAVNNEYSRLKDEHDELKRRVRNYENDTQKGIFDYAEKIDFLYNSPEYRRYEIFENYRKDIEALDKELKEAREREPYGEDARQIEAYLNEVKKEMVREAEETYKRKKLNDHNNSAALNLDSERQKNKAI